MPESHPPTKATVLVVDDSPEWLDTIAAMLGREGYRVVEAMDGAGAVAAVEERDPQLVLLDLSLPDLDGMEVCRLIGERSDALVMMLTGRDDELDRVMGLKSGADDYVTKPFSPRELLARVEALLRRRRPRTAETPDDDRRVGPLVIRPEAREVDLDGTSVEFTRIEFDILDALTRRPRVVHSRVALRDEVWGPDWFGDDHVVDVHIANIRKKLDAGRAESLIRTVRGVGYRMNL